MLAELSAIVFLKGVFKALLRETLGFFLCLINKFLSKELILNFEILKKESTEPFSFLVNYN